MFHFWIYKICISPSMGLIMIIPSLILFFFQGSKFFYREFSDHREFSGRQSQQIGESFLRNSSGLLSTLQISQKSLSLLYLIWARQYSCEVGRGHLIIPILQIRWNKLCTICILWKQRELTLGQEGKLRRKLRQINTLPQSPVSF